MVFTKTTPIVIFWLILFSIDLETDGVHVNTINISENSAGK